MEELDVFYVFDLDLAYYGMREIVVDGIPSSWIGTDGEHTLHRNNILDMRDDVDDMSTERVPYFSGPYGHTYDGYPIDEEVYLKVGWIISTNPINHLDREEALKR